MLYFIGVNFLKELYLFKGIMSNDLGIVQITRDIFYNLNFYLPIYLNKAQKK
jgi:hypothetical protein